MSREIDVVCPNCGKRQTVYPDSMIARAIRWHGWADDYCFGCKEWVHVRPVKVLLTKKEAGDGSS